MLFSILQFWLKNGTETSDHTADCLQQVFNSLKPIRFFRNYLNFFCLGQRSPSQDTPPPSCNPRYLDY